MLPRVGVLLTVFAAAALHRVNMVDAVPPDPKGILLPKHLEAARDILIERTTDGTNFPFMSPFLPGGVAKLRFKNFVHRLKTHLETKLFPASDLQAWRRKNHLRQRGSRFGDRGRGSEDEDDQDDGGKLEFFLSSHHRHQLHQQLETSGGASFRENETSPTMSTTPAPTAGPMNPTMCAVHALAYVNALQLFASDPLNRDWWPAEMLDATGKWPDGILIGNLVSLGSYDECLAVRANFAGDELVVGLGDTGISMDVFPVPLEFKGKYCRAQLDLKVLEGDPTNPVSAAIGQENVDLLIAGGVNPAIGICMPNSCSSVELKEALDAAAAGIGFRFIVNDRDCAEDTPTVYTGGDYAMMAVLLVVIVLAIAGTIVDVKLLNAKKALAAASKKTDGGQTSLTDSGLKTFQNDLWVQFLTSFSVYSNGKKILSTDTSSPDNIGCLHGLRFISMTWVILAHSYGFGGINPWVNLADGLPLFLRQWEFTAVANASTSVDTFFLLSGLLVAYVVLKELRRSKGRLRPDPASFLGMYYIVRYIRLTPAFAVGIGLAATLMRHVANGPLWGQLLENSDLCQNDWWKYMIYAHNYVRPDVNYDGQITCFPQSWYLACDMQLFILSPLFIFPMFYAKKFAYFWIGGLTAASIIPGLVIQIQHDWYPPTLLPNNNKLDYFYDIYANTYVRAGPYFIGIAIGYFLLSNPKGTLKLKKAVVIGGWAVAAATALAVVYGLADYFPYESAAPSHAESIIYAAFGRVAWAAAVAWVIIACHYGYGGPVNALLSWEPFMPLGRLTYCSYLLSIYVQYMFQFSRKDVQYNDHQQMVYWFLGTLTLTNAGAFVFSLLFEAPLMGIVKIITAGLKGQPRQRPPTQAPRKEENGIGPTEVTTGDGKVNAGFEPDNKPGHTTDPKILHSKIIPEEIIEIPSKPAPSQ